jgi:hypothetical protein
MNIHGGKAHMGMETRLLDPFWLSLFAKSTLVVFILWSSHPHCHVGNSPMATLSFGLPNVLWATPYLECIERSMWKVFGFNFMFCLC